MSKKQISAALIAILLQTTVWAQNPIAQTCYSTDPAPMVYGDRLYVFTGHDEEGADFFWMNDWRLFSTADMVNWQDHGSPLSLSDFTWADDRAWAPQCVERNGKFYFYIPAHSNISGGMAIGVAVSDNITGPYIDPLGKPLYEDVKWDHIDPTVLIDDDDKAYIYWGNPKLYSARLSDDMISLASEVKVDSTLERYTEGPWIHKVKKGQYIMMYAAGGVPECIAYSTAKKPQGPWTYQGEVMKQDNGTQSFTNHSGLIDFKGHSYFFYHTGWLPGGGGFGRSACVEEFSWNADGTLPLIPFTKEGPAPISTFNPYTLVEAETMADSRGIRSEFNKKEKRVWVSDIHNGDWLKVREVDFEKGLSSMEFTAATPLNGGAIEVRLDKVDGELIATATVTPTGGWEEWQTFCANVSRSVSGKHDVYFVFCGLKGGKLFNFDSWQAKEKEISKY